MSETEEFKVWASIPVGDDLGTLDYVLTDQMVAEIPVGKKPRGTAISADGRLAYVSDQPNNRLVMVDLVARKVSGTIALGESPEGVGISPDGRWVVAAVEESNQVVFIDTATGRKAFERKVTERSGCCRPGLREAIA